MNDYESTEYASRKELHHELDIVRAELHRTRRASRRTLLLAITVACIGVPVASHAVGMLNTFNAGDPIVASDINENFETLREAVEGLEDVDAQDRLAALERTPVVATYSLGSDQALPNSAETRIDFGSEDVDTHDAVDPGADWAFTAPRDGYYAISASVFNLSEYGRTSYLYLVKNGNHLVTIGQECTPNNACYPVASTTVWLSAEDRLYAATWANASSSHLTAGTHSRIAIHEIR